MDITNIINQMLILLLLMLLGLLGSKLGVLDAEGNKSLTRLAMNICLPAMILDSVMSGELPLALGDVFLMIGLSFLAHFCYMLFGLAFPALTKAAPSDGGTFRFALAYGNCTFMGFPVVRAIFGEGAVFYAAMFAIPFNLLIYTVGTALISGGRGEGFSLRLMLSPAVVSTLLSIVLLLLKLSYPQPLIRTVGMLGDMIVPLSMLIIGSSLGRISLREFFGGWRAYLYLPIKLIAIPVVVWAVFRLFVRDETLLGVVTILSAMPGAAVTTMLSIQYGGNVPLASKLVFLSSILSSVTIPLVCYLLLI